VLVLTPVVPPAGALPYYHPAVNHLALRYIPALPSSSSPDPADVSSWGALELLAVPHVPVDARDPSSRLHRTCRALLESLHRYGWGARLSYRKRAQHDRLVPREPYQDLYLLMRERHKGLVETWAEATDPLKHVFEVRAAYVLPIANAEGGEGYRHRDVPYAPVERHFSGVNTHN
jgi:tRNASer (uridine44-2'-O)-methyltransferase